MRDVGKEMHRTSMKHFGFGTETMKSIKVCGICGTVSSVKKRRCPECGGKLPMQSLFAAYRLRHHTCSQCGLVVSDSARFCPGCGVKLPESEKETSQPTKIFSKSS